MQSQAARPRPETLERLEAQITELWGHLNAATYRFLALVAEFDRQRGAMRGTACRARRSGSTGNAASAWSRRARRSASRARSRRLPEISAGFASGEFSYSKVRAMTRVATPANEAVLASIARHGTASHVEKLVRKYRWTQRRDAEKTRAGAAPQSLGRTGTSTRTRRSCCNARLPPEIGALVAQALKRRKTCCASSACAMTRDELRAARRT